MKKGIILLVSMLLIAVVLTACGDNKSAGKEKVEMRTYTMANGKKVEIPAHPKGMLASEYLGNMVLLG
ncbi:iron ABC transporter substrate-binding protein, partial [Escherichia coli]|nr:iron ABC transporter substrate-binding protein [Escherichia coli]